MLRQVRPFLIILLGSFVGLLLASLDHILPPASLQTGPTKWLVVFVDWMAPPIAGVLIAGALLYAQRARRLHAAERAAAAVLADRLAGTERRQAIWVVAAAVAHDLKNPLHNLQLLVEEVSESEDPQQREQLLQRIRENVQRATERLSELSRAGQQVAETMDQKIDLAAALEELRVRLKPTLEATRATVEIDCPRGLAVRGDAHAVRTAVENVAANALEALQSKGAGGRLALRAQQFDGRVELTVQDDGPGIPVDVKSRLFTPFSSGHNGTGLGLAIARALARAGGGDLVCSDAAPGRTTFRFTFQRS
ncbi:MAG: HAMP domain-containing histidine kinase [Deltaproteobacteria bacterium]|nr:MAG: HAMP domain-containing histidine kinase [Deltaproteobacteria bacterium]